MFDGISMAVAICGFAIGYFITPRRPDDRRLPLIVGLAAAYCAYVATWILIPAFAVMGPVYFTWRYFRDMHGPLREAWQRFWIEAGIRVRTSTRTDRTNRVIDRLIKRRSELQAEINAFEQAAGRQSPQRRLQAERLYDELDLLDDSLGDLI